MKKVFTTKDEARSKLFAGLNKVADAIGSTLGPFGRNAIIGRPYQSPLITNDGATIAREMVLEDEIEQLAVEVIKQVTKRTDDKAGDGTSTTTELTRSVANEAFKFLDTETTIITKAPMVLKREIDTATEQAQALLMESKQEVETLEQLQGIASVSMENETLGNLIGKTYWDIGKDGVITVEESNNPTVEAEIIQGLELPFGFTSADLATTTDGKCVFEKPYILLTTHKIGSVAQLTPIITKVIGETKQLVVISEHFESSFVTSTVIHKLQGGFHILSIKSPTGRKDFLKDLGALIGAEIIEEEKGMKLEDISLEKLGRCDKITASKDKTIVVGGAGKPEAYLNNLKVEAEKSDSIYDKENLEKRIAKLTGGIAIIRVGASSETEKEYLKLKVDDAVNATKWAFRNGYVKGGGLALKEVADQLGDTIITKALCAPYKKIQDNAGTPFEIPDTIIDPYHTVSEALKSAASTAGIFITTEVAIAIKNETDKNKSEDDN